MNRLLLLFTCALVPLLLPLEGGELHNRFLIVANGPYDSEVVLALAAGRTLIALDGAANNLEGVHPDFILGDFDSIKPQSKEKYEGLDVTFIAAPDQDATDLEKGIAFARSLGATEIAVCCALGGSRTDHTIGNLSALRSLYAPSCPIEFHTCKEVIVFLQDGRLLFEGQPGAKCGFFGWPRAKVTTEGLVWDVSDWDTEIGGRISSCNELRTPSAVIQAEGSVLIVYPKKAT